MPILPPPSYIPSPSSSSSSGNSRLSYGVIHYEAPPSRIPYLSQARRYPDMDNTPSPWNSNFDYTGSFAEEPLQIQGRRIQPSTQEAGLRQVLYPEGDFDDGLPEFMDGEVLRGNSDDLDDSDSSDDPPDCVEFDGEDGLYDEDSESDSASIPELESEHSHELRLEELDVNGEESTHIEQVMRWQSRTEEFQNHIEDLLLDCNGVPMYPINDGVGHECDCVADEESIADREGVGESEGASRSHQHLLVEAALDVEDKEDSEGSSFVESERYSRRYTLSPSTQGLAERSGVLNLRLKVEKKSGGSIKTSTRSKEVVGR